MKTGGHITWIIHIKRCDRN